MRMAQRGALNRLRTLSYIESQIDIMPMKRNIFNKILPFYRIYTIFADTNIEHESSQL